LSVLSYEFVTFIGPIVSPILDRISEAVKALVVNFDNLKPVIAGVVTALGVLLAGSLVALTGFMLSLSPPMTAVAVAAGGIATAFVALQPYVQVLGQWFLANVPGLNTFLNNLRQIGDYIGSVFIQAWGQ
jgi:phage-related minor tail protein